MKILALEASATAASVALCDNERLLAESFTHSGKTHSQTLMPMVGELLRITDTELASLDLLAVTSGPGSFTGLRIAIAAVKGMALGAGLRCVGVSSLWALACNLRGFEGVAAAVMDARCGQVYTALFDLQGGTVTRRTEDMAIPIAELQKMLETEKKPVFLVGDGAELCYNILLGKVVLLQLAPAHLRMNRAASVAYAAGQAAAQGQTVEPGALLPGYLRLPQAERELLAKQQSGQTE